MQTVKLSLLYSFKRKMRRWVRQHDNDPKYSSKSLKEWFKKRNRKVTAALRIVHQSEISSQQHPEVVIIF
uniref:Uncharacterized protein n=1 Tax=Astyanax mexicanus TaxID=7994 RepID=A0A3B1K0J2_ASTMX